jgi:hypothetical protein
MIWVVVRGPKAQLELLNVIPPLSLHSNRLNTGENVRDTITIAIR